MEDLNIQWKKQKNNNKLGEMYADVGDHYLVVQHKAIVDLSLRCMWCIVDKKGNLIHHGEEVTAVAEAMVGSQQTGDSVLERAKKAAEEEYYERLFVEQVIKNEVLCDESS